MNQAFDSASLDWQPVRPNITHGIFGKTLLDDKTKVVLTRVAPGGRFETHRDNYAHLFYFLSGEGVVQVDDKRFDAHAGLVVQIAAGQAHAYENTGNADLMLISMNLST